MHKDGYTVFYDCLRNKTSVTSFLYCINGTMMNAMLVTSSYTIVPPSGINGKLYQGQARIQQGLNLRIIFFDNSKTRETCFSVYGMYYFVWFWFCSFSAALQVCFTSASCNFNWIPRKYYIHFNSLSLLRWKSFI